MPCIDIKKGKTAVKPLRKAIGARSRVSQLH